MTSIRRILVAVRDYEAKTIPALVKAGQLAQAFGARIELFHAICGPLYVDGYTVTGVELPRMEQSMRARVLARLEKMAADSATDRDALTRAQAQIDDLLKRPEMAKGVLVVVDKEGDGMSKADADTSLRAQVEALPPGPAKAAAIMQLVGHTR